MAARQVVFECHCSSTVPGQWVAVVGSSPQLGCWDVRRSVRLHTNASSFPLWSSPPVSLSVAAAAAPASAAAAGSPGGAAAAGGFAAAEAASKADPVEFKFIICGPDASRVSWEQLQANRLLLPSGPRSLRYRARFGEPSEELLLLQQQQQQETPPKQRGQQQEATWMGRSRDAFSSSLKRLSSGLDLSPQSTGGTASPLSVSPGAAESCARLLNPTSTSTSSAGTAAAAAGAAGSLLSPSGALSFIVEGNASAPSWGAKLELVKSVVKNAGDGSSLAKASAEQLVVAIDALCYAGVYADLVSQGALRCSEDGRHLRPNRHANISREVSVHLELLLQAVASRTDDFASVLRLVARRILPSLPSFAAAFRAAQPLTRIRNIAHRDDIPMELKNEIKHKIQNKLHRCAGPEDLEATQQLLQRVHAARGQYSSGFVSELETFYKELCFFFNQYDLTERLKELLPRQTPRTAEAIERYLDAKERSNTADASPAKLLLALGLATNLRFVFVLQLTETGHLHEGDEQQIQNLRMTEIQLEDSAFVLFSRLVNLFEDPYSEFRWTDAIEALYLGTRNIEASGVRKEECRALQRELQNHARADLNDEESMLLLKATVERTRRLCEEISDLMLAVYVHRVDALGSRLGVQASFLSVYTEGCIRSSIIFQLSKVAHVLLRGLRQHLQQQPYDILVPGHFVGEVIVAATLKEAVATIAKANHASSSSSNSSSGNSSSSSSSSGSGDGEASGGSNKEEIMKKEVKPLIVCCRSASGDEEIAALSSGAVFAAGVFVAHELPILSHLGVRARQQKLPFICCVERSCWETVAAKEGSWVEVHADGRGVQIKELNQQEAAAAAAAAAQTAAAAAAPGGREARRQTQYKQQQQQYNLSSSSSSHPQFFVDISLGPPRLLRGEQITINKCGAKAATCARLEAAAAAAAAAAAGAAAAAAAPPAATTSPPAAADKQFAFKAPRCMCLPFGSMEWALHEEGREEEYKSLLQQLEQLQHEGEEMKRVCACMQQLIMSLSLPPGVEEETSIVFGNRSRICLRSSANVEDLKGLSAAGLYESVVNVAAGDSNAIKAAACTVWASLFSSRAVSSRKAAGIRQSSACMAILFQELVVPDISFILHTGGLKHQRFLYACKDKDTDAYTPNNNNNHNLNHNNQTPEVYAELVPGLGEALASSTMRGSAYRMLIDKETGAYKLLSACSYSNIILPVIPRSKSFLTLRDNGSAGSSTVEPEKLLRFKVYDQTADSFASSHSLREKIAKQIAAVSVFLDGPQDVEGVISKNDIYIVQARPQAEE